MHRLREGNYYLLNALKFYEMKNDRLTPILFVIILFAGFIGVFLPQTLAVTIAYNLVSVLVIFFASNLYLCAYLRDLKREEYSLKTCAQVVWKNILRLGIASVLYLLMTLVGSLLFVIPGIIIYVTFLFTPCFILDQSKSIFESFTASNRLSNGRKMQIFGVIVIYFLVLLVLMMTFTTMFGKSGNGLVLAFVVSFLGSVTNFMQQRLLALLYIDLEYGIYNRENGMDSGL